MTWKGTLQNGVNLFKQKRYEEALEVFTQAIRENDNEKALFDSRAAVFEKLNRPADALKDCKKVIGLAPTSWQGYARSARLFLQIDKPEASLKMVEAALERIKPTDMKRRVELEALRDQAVKAVQPPICHFLRLPVEIQTEIFSFVIDGSNTKMLALTFICRHWRQVILDTPKFWRHLVVSRGTTQRKVVTWLDRSCGVLSSLRIAQGINFSEEAKIFMMLPWSSLDSLILATTRANFDQMIASGIIRQLRLRSLHLDVDEVIPDLWRAFDRVDSARMRSVNVTGIDSLDDFPFSALTKLILNNRVPRSELLKVLKINQSLETLVVGGPKSFRSPDEEPRSIGLPNLKHLHVNWCHDASYYLQIVQPEKLKTLHLAYISGAHSIRSLKVIASQRLTLLEELDLSRVSFSSKDLVSILQTANLLKSLTVAHCTYVEGDEGVTIETLSKPKPASENSLQSLCCPRLQHVNLSGSPQLKTSPVVRLVKAHLPNTITQSDSESCNPSSSGSPEVEPLPILSLNVDDCPMIDADALPWLRANVPRFSCKMKPVKMGRGRR